MDSERQRESRRSGSENAISGGGEVRKDQERGVQEEYEVQTDGVKKV